MVVYLNMLLEPHQTFYELEQLGVFKRPEDVGILVKYLNPSFHLVTAFADVGRYSKPQPFPSRPAWLAIQFYCPDLCRTHAQFVQGTCSSNKVTNVKNVKRYLNLAAISKDGLLVVMCTEPLTTTRERIIVPRLSPPWILGVITHPPLSPFRPPTQDCSQPLPVCLRCGQGCQLSH